MATIFISIWGMGVVVLFLQQRSERRELEARFLERCENVGTTLESFFRSLRRLASHEQRKGLMKQNMDELVQIGQFRDLFLLNQDGESVLKKPLPKLFPWKDLVPGEVFFHPTETLCAVVTPLELEVMMEKPHQEDRPMGRFRRRGAQSEPRPFDGPKRRFENNETTQGRHHQNSAQQNTPHPNTLNQGIAPLRTFKNRHIQRFVAIMSTTEMRTRLQQSRQLRIALAVASLLGLMLLYVFILRMQRLKIMRDELIEKEIRNQDLEEKNLAAAGLAHETRTPLGVVRGLAQLQSEDNSLSPEVQKRSLAMVDEVDRITSRLNDFIEYSRMRDPKWDVVDTSGLFTRLEVILEDDFEDAKIKFHWPKSKLPQVKGDEDMLQQVFFNIIHNAIQVCPEGTDIKVRWGDKLGVGTMVIEDNGPGIPQALISTLFSPYVTSRKGGTGLGLAVCRQICQRHGLELLAKNNASGGASFRIKGFKVVKDDAVQGS